MTASPPARKRRPQARELHTPTTEHILATIYAGQVRAAVIERALKRMAAADARRDRATAPREGRRT